MHLISAIDLNLFQPLDLGITQKSFRVGLKEEKEEKIILLFHEQIGRRRAREQGIFLDKKEKEAAVWHTYQAALQQNQNSRKTSRTAARTGRKS